MITGRGNTRLTSSLRVEVDVKRKIIDDFLPVKDLIQLQNMLLGRQFPWYFSNSTVVANDGVGRGNHWYKFNHSLYADSIPMSAQLSEFNSFIHAIRPAAINIFRAFMTTYTGERVNQGMHRDYEATNEDDKSVYAHLKTAIFYVNTNNGGTLFEDGQFVNSVANRVLIFNSNELHSAVTADDVPARVILNLNYF